MAVWTCRECTAAYAVGAPRCPNCGSPAHAQEGEQDVPKITVHGGATNAADETREEEPSPGTSSSTSSTKDAHSPETSENAPAKPARTTESRSKRARTGSSTARGTDGDPTAPTSDN